MSSSVSEVVIFRLVWDLGRPLFLCLGGPFLGAKRGFILNPILQPLFEVPIQFRLDLIAVSMWILIRVFALITIGTTRFDVDWMSVERLHFLHVI